jgi:uncharacterized protein
MSIKQRINEGIKEAMREKQQLRLDTLRMAKGALLLKEKEGPKDQPLSDADAIATLRSEIRKRQQSIQTYTEVNRPEEVDRLLQELAVFEEFLPHQLSEAELETRVREYLAAHPEVNHAGKLTGAMKKELGDLADGRMLNDVCRRALES